MSIARRSLLSAALCSVGVLVASPALGQSHNLRPKVVAPGHGGPAVSSAKSAQATAPVSNDMRASGFVYTLDNDVYRNGVAVFRRQSDGSLVPLPGSPFQAGGRGLSGGDIDEQGAIRVHGKYVLAVNPGSDSIAVMEKSSRGLLHVEGSPFPSGGSTPLSLGVHGDLVYVANQAAPFASPKSAPNITGFRLAADGRLTPLANSTIAFPEGQGPAQVEFSPTGKVLVVTAGFQKEDSSRLYSFRVMHDGCLTPGPGSPIKPEGAFGTVGFSWGARGDHVYATLFSGSAVIAFAVDPATAAIRQAGEPKGDDQRAACWSAISRDGRTLYVGNFVSNSISVYDVAGDQLTLLGSIPRRGATDKDTKDIELSKDGKFLYAVGSGKREISVFRVEANRLLTELPRGQSPLTVATGQNITGLVTD
jgi:6-phosphogluconolactonase (cycloisomerase 2 family)